MEYNTKQYALRLSLYKASRFWSEACALKQNALHCALVNHFFRLTWFILSTAFLTASLSTLERYLTNSLATLAAYAAAGTKAFVETRSSKAYQFGQNGSSPKPDAEAYSHEDLATAPHHPDTPTIDLHRGRGRGTDLITEILMEHFECEGGLPSRVCVDACNEQANARIRKS
jgi:hypothetical protein